MKEILVYFDEGVSSSSYRETVEALKKELPYPIQTVNHRFFLHSDWFEKTALVVFPGGRDRPYQERLQGQANRHIQTFVQNGGSFLGICAGGYYGAAAIEFEKGGELEICAPRELGFFAGKAVGPAYGNNRFRYDSEEGAQAAWVQWKEGLCPVYFNGGCLFEEAERHANVQVIARYNDLVAQPAAVVRCHVGQGVALLSGVHPEYSAQSLHSSHAAYNVLQQEEGARKAFWRHLLSCFIF